MCLTSWLAYIRPTLLISVKNLHGPTDVIHAPNDVVGVFMRGKMALKTGLHLHITSEGWLRRRVDISLPYWWELACTRAACLFGFVAWTVSANCSIVMSCSCSCCCFLLQMLLYPCPPKVFYLIVRSPGQMFRNFRPPLNVNTYNCV